MQDLTPRLSRLIRIRKVLRLIIERALPINKIMEETMNNIVSTFEKKAHGAFQIVIARKLRACFGAVMALAFLLVSPMASSAGYTLDTSTSPSPITGLWWNQNESGWGAALTQQYDVIFVTMYTYDGAGNPTWYVASNCAVTGGGCQGDLYKVTGGSMLTVPWNGNNKVVTTVGTISLAFTDNNTGTMNYTINGVNGSKAITRQVWRTAPPAGGSPYIQADVISLAGGSNPDPLGWLQTIKVYTSNHTPITNASVTVNGSSPLPYSADKQSYYGNSVIAPGATVNLSVTVGGTTYSASGTQYTTFPSVTAPAPGSTWWAVNANTITWTVGAPTAGANYFVGIADINGNIVYPVGNQGPLSTSYTVPANSLTAGNYVVIVAIGGLPIPIPNTATDSYLWISGFTFVPITVY